MQRFGLVVALALAAGQAAAESPRILYMLECQGCHLADGTGVPGSVPSLAGNVARFLTVPGGREYLVAVPGSAQAPLTNSELAAVLNWVVIEFGPSEVADQAPRFTEEEVARNRHRPLVSVEEVRSDLLHAMENRENTPSRK